MLSNKVKYWLTDHNYNTIKYYQPYRIDNVLVIYGKNGGKIVYPNDENKLITQELYLAEDGYSIIDIDDTSYQDKELNSLVDEYIKKNAIPVNNTCTNDIMYYTTPWKTLPDDLNIWPQLNDDTKKLLMAEYEKECTAYQLALEKYFGKDNLVPPPPINNWDDLIKIQPELSKKLNDFYKSIEDLFIRDIEYMIAQFKIINLINRGYGGIIKKREWQDQTLIKWRIVVNSITGNPTISSTVHDTGELLAFRSREETERFKKYNLELVDYFLRR